MGRDTADGRRESKGPLERECVSELLQPLVVVVRMQKGQ